MNRNPVKRAVALVMALMIIAAGIMVNPQPTEAAAKKPTDITLNAKTKTLYLGGPTFTLKVQSVKPGNASKDVKFTSSKSSVAAVNSKTGVVTAKKKGTAAITVTSRADSKVKAKCKIIVKQRVTGITLNKSSAVLKKGNKLTLKATIKPSNANNRNVNWRSSKPNVASVNSKGVVTAKKAGTAKITVTAMDGSKAKKAVVTCKVTVIQPVTGVTISPDSKALAVNETAQLKATVTPSNASNKNVKWLSSDISKAAVSGSGLVTAIAEGTVTITAMAADGSGRSASCRVKVTAAAKVPEDVKETQTLTIIHINDMHGYADETSTSIGYAKLAALIDRMKEEDPNTIALDAGDTFAGSPNAAYDKGESILSILNTVAFDAMVLGNHESYLGVDRISDLTGRLHYKALAGNVVTTGGDYLWEPYTIISLKNGLKVGVVTATCGGADGLEYLDPIASLQRQVNEIKADVDVIVALTHLGVEDASGNTSQKVAVEVEGIDVIIDGHSHSALEQGIEVNGVLIAQTGEYGKNIGITELTISEGAVASASSRLITKEEMAGANVKEETLEATTKLQTNIAAYYAEVIGVTTVDLIGTSALIRTQETNMGNLYTDAVREGTGAQIALCAAGIIGGEIPAGNITRGDVLSISRVFASYVVGEMKGEDIINALEDHVKFYPEPSGSFFQVSGISFKIDSGKSAGERVHSVYVGGEEIDPDEIYTVAFSALGKNNVGFVNATIIEDDFPGSDELIANYILKHNIISPMVEGRIIESSISE